MDIYHYDKNTGEAVGQSIASLDPIEGKKLIPANAVEIAPPLAGANKAAKWNGSAWELVDDYRGFKAFDSLGIEHKIELLEIKPDPSWTIDAPLIPPAPAQELAESDSGMVRMVEDLINVLVTQNVITLDQLPLQAVEKLANRATLRSQLK